VHADDERDFREFAAARMESLRNLAYLSCGDWQVAEDAVSTALARLYVRWRRVNAPDSYARTMVVRAAIDEKRRPWRRERPSSNALPDVAFADPSGDTDERLRVTAALRKVPARQRAAIVLRYYEGLSVEETAAALGCREGTVKSQTLRGLATLRSLLSNERIRLIERDFSGEDRHVVRPAGRT
jgi:RNA polymerase sigma-70 factor (sigma-E family)